MPEKPKRTTLIPLAILAVCVVGAIGVAGYLSSSNVAESPAPAPATPPPAPEPERVIDLEAGGHIRGDANAPILLVEYGDYGCPHCAAAHPFVVELMRRMPDRLALEFHHLPIPVVDNSWLAARAAEAAGEQGHYWEMHDMLFERINEWSYVADGQAYFTELARELGLDTTRFLEHLNSAEIVDRVEIDRERGIRLGVSSTPTFFVDGQFFDMPVAIDEAEVLLRTHMEP